MNSTPSLEVERLCDLLSGRPGLSAREIARHLGLPKGVVNPVLYHRRDLFEARPGPGSAPVWRIRHAASPVTRVGFAPAPRRRTRSTEPGAALRQSLGHSRTRDVAPVVVPAPLMSWQSDALQAWEIAGRRGIVDAVTGSGKTRLALEAITRHLKGGGGVLVVVPTVVLLHQWASVLEGATGRRVGLLGDGYDETGHGSLVVATLASARRRRVDPGEAEGLLVVDECHRIAAECSSTILSPAWGARLGLSATHERLDQAHLSVLMPYFGSVVYQLDLRRAVDQGVVSPVRAAFIGVELLEEERERVEMLVTQLSRLRRRLVAECGCRPAPFTAFLDDVVGVSRRGPRAGGLMAQQWLKAWSAKREILAETPTKLAAVEGLIDAMVAAERTLIFTQSIESASRIVQSLRTRGMRVAAHHSGVEPERRAAVMAAFATGDLRVVVSVQTLEEGIDVPEADLAIIVAASKQRRQMVQRMGRVLRRKPDGRDARIVFLYALDTDEDPRRGAHEVFIEELVDVARATLVTEGVDDRVVEFLDPTRDEGKLPALA